MAQIRRMRARLEGLFGLGHVYVGRLGLAIAFVCGTLSLVTILVWTRLIFRPEWVCALFKSENRPVPMGAAAGASKGPGCRVEHLTKCELSFATRQSGGPPRWRRLGNLAAKAWVTSNDHVVWAKIGRIRRPA
jgi:hypothetical protein